MSRPTNPRHTLADNLRALRVAAGAPSLAAVVERAKQLNDPTQGIPPNRRRIGEWESGTYVPANWGQFALVLEALIELAEVETPEPPAKGLYKLKLWSRWWQAARERELADENCPYRGLEPFDQEHAGQFFGRDAVADELVVRFDAAVQSGGQLMVVGPSGVGKSSLLRAGLLPRIAAGGLTARGSANWPVTLMSPGPDPLGVLVQQLPGLAESLGPPSVSSPITWTPSTAAGDAPLGEPALTEGPPTISGPAITAVDQARDAVRSHVERRAGPGARAILVIDQFEELFTLCTVRQRAQFVDLLAALSTSDLSRSAPIMLIVILRADFYLQCLQYKFLRLALSDHQMALAGIDATDLRDIITGPAEDARLRIERGLVELILADAGASGVEGELDVGTLPLVSHALSRTWEHRKSATLTIDGYTAAGGINGAIGRTAEAAWAELDDTGQRAADQLIVQLVQIGDGVAIPDTRRRCKREDLLSRAADRQAAETALEVLVRARLITAEAEWIQLAHETLLQSWPRLPELINRYRHELLLSSRVEEDADVWESASRDVNLLYRGGRLDEALQWQHDATIYLPSGRATRFVAAAQRYRQRHAWIRTTAAISGLTLALIAGFAAVIAISQTRGERFANTLAQADRLASTDPSLASRLYLSAHQMRGQDPTVNGRLLSTQNSPLAATLPSPDGAIYDVNYSRDGRSLVTASYTGMIQIWDNRDPAQRHPVGPPLQIGGGYASTAVLSNDGHTLVGAGEGGTLQVWDVSALDRPKQLGRAIYGGHGVIYLARFSPAGHLLATANQDGTVALWDFSDPMNPRALGPPPAGARSQIRTVAFSTDGRLLAAGDDDGTVWLWDLSNPTDPVPAGPPMKGHVGAVHTVAFSPDGGMLAAGGDDKSTWLWDITNTQRPVAIGTPLRGQNGAIWAVAFAPSGESLATASANGSVGLWGVSHSTGGWPVAYLPGATGPLWSLSYSPDGYTIAAGGENGSTSLWSIPSTVLIGHTSRVLSLAVSHTGALLASGGADHCVRLWDIHDPQHPRPAASPLCSAGNGFVYGLSFNHDDTVLASESAQDGVVTLWDVREPSRPTPLGNPLHQHTQWAGRCVFSPDGHLLVTGDTDSTVQIWDASDPDRLRPLGPPLNAHDPGLGINSILFTPDSRVMITASSDGTARLWDVTHPENPSRLATITPQVGQLLQAAVSPDGRILATTGEDKRLRLWDISERTHPRLLGRPLQGHGQTVNAVAFSSDSRTLGSGGADFTARLWNIANPTDVPASEPLTGHKAGINAVAFTRDGRLITAGEDNSIMIWNTDLDAAIQRICATTLGSTDAQSIRENGLADTRGCSN